MKPLLLLATSLFLISCTVPAPYYQGSKHAPTAFIDGHKANLSLRQISNTKASYEQIDFIAKNYVYNEAKSEFTTSRPINYKPIVRSGDAYSADSLYSIAGPGIEPVVRKINGNPQKFSRYILMRAGSSDVVFLFGSDNKLVDLWTSTGKYGAPVE